MRQWDVDVAQVTGALEPPGLPGATAQRMRKLLHPAGQAKPTLGEQMVRDVAACVLHS